MPEPIVHQESMMSVAIDGARIAAYLAVNITANSELLLSEQTAAVLDCLEQAVNWLNEARSLMPVETTSLHVAAGTGPRIEIARG